MRSVYCFAGYKVQIDGLSEGMKRFLCEYRIDSAPEITLSVPDKETLERGQEEITLETLARGLLQKGVLLLHGSAIAYGGNCYVFCAPSGTGKSTHTALWRDLLGEEAFMVNDDKPFLRIEEDGARVCGSPFDGKHRLSRNVMVSLRSICFLSQAPENSITRLSFREALPALLESTYRPDSAQEVVRVLNLLETLGRHTKFYSLRCTPQPEAAEIAAAAMIEYKESGTRRRDE